MCNPVQSLAYASIMGYYTSIISVHYGFGDRPSASIHQVLHTLMRENHCLGIETDLKLSQGARSLAQGPLEQDLTARYMGLNGLPYTTGIRPQG